MGLAARFVGGISERACAERATSRSQSREGTRTSVMIWNMMAYGRRG